MKEGEGALLAWPAGVERGEAGEGRGRGGRKGRQGARDEAAGDGGESLRQACSRLPYSTQPRGGKGGLGESEGVRGYGVQGERVAERSVEDVERRVSAVMH